MSFIDYLHPRDVPSILFRLVHNGRFYKDSGKMWDPLSFCFDDEQSLVAWHMSRTADEQAFDDHLAWQRMLTPFLSCFSDWGRVSRRREWAIRQGFQNVRIIATWSKGLMNVYKAETAIAAMGPAFYERHKNLRPSYFEDEYLIDAAVYADEYKLLAIFNDNDMRPARVLSLQNEIDIRTLQDILESIYMSTGVRNFEALEQLFGAIFGDKFVARFLSTIVVDPCHGPREVLFHENFREPRFLLIG